MSGSEMLVRNLWRARFGLARPTATYEATERAIDSVLRDPSGSYAREITEAADRALAGRWTPMSSPETEPNEP